MWSSKVQNYWQNSDDGKTTRVVGDKNWVSDNQPKKIHIKMLNSIDGDEIIYTMSPTTPFAKLLDAYAKKMKWLPGSLLVNYDGERLDRSRTPESYGMMDNTCLDAYLEQVGG